MMVVLVMNGDDCVGGCDDKVDALVVEMALLLLILADGWR